MTNRTKGTQICASVSIQNNRFNNFVHLPYCLTAAIQRNPLKLQLETGDLNGKLGQVQWLNAPEILKT